MKKYLFALLTIIVVIISTVTYAQDSNSIQVNGGIFMPMSSSKGFNTSIQYNYHLSNNIQLYIYSGYSSWDRFNVIFTEDWSTIQKQTHFSTYISDNHILIPVFIGSRINFHSSKLFTSFATFEIGYSNLSYDNYGIKKEINPVTGEVLSYNPDLRTKKEITENLLGIGAGVGLSHTITENINIILSFKLNSQLNSKDYSFLSSRGTYTAINLGFNFNL
ncbi:MAG: hypothetical protein K9J12_01470 [Melioribacteraceae bacterium]|nr:hypothetical protein [Melioribacteraceae bacterium]MCF8432757.1 hypothetical protein [Melioribacteraceae bacterium]